MDEIKTSIPNFYRDRSVLITGAAGFVGKVLVEKLLRSCPDIKTIYLLLRSRKGQEAQQKLDELLKSKLFERIKREKPNAIYKLVAIQGDLTVESLGIHPQHEELIAENVSVVFHVAATVQFDKPLKQAFDTNVFGTRRIVDLCRKMKKLEALIYVSTAFCIWDPEPVEEVIYQVPVSPRKVIDTIEWMGEDIANALTPHLLRGTPNTYLYTKALTEAFLDKEYSDLPITIIRPSIVAATWKEPIPGWVDNYNAATRFFASISKGLLRCVYCKPSSAADIIPVDVVVNLVIAAAWHTAIHRPKTTMVYNCTSSSINKVTFHDVLLYCESSAVRYPSHEIFRHPRVFGTSNKALYYIFTAFYHNMPAYFYDFLSVVTGRKPKLVRLCNRLHKQIDSVQFAASRDWNFSSKNVIKLQETLLPEDAKEFDFNIKPLSWPDYMEGYVLGIRQYLFKDNPSSIQTAQKTQTAQKKIKKIQLFLYKKLSTPNFCIAVLLFLWMVIFMNGRSN